MTDPDADGSDLLQRAEQAQAQSKALRKQIARAAEAVAKTEQDVARVHRRLAAEGGRLAAAAREHADRAAELAAKERAEAARLRQADSDQGGVSLLGAGYGRMQLLRGDRVHGPHLHPVAATARPRARLRLAGDLPSIVASLGASCSWSATVVGCR